VETTEIDGFSLGIEPTQKRGVEARDRLFDAAMEEFEARGIQGSRVENIVAEAGTSWGTFFRYFPRKEDVLLFAAARHFRTYLRPVYEAGLGDPDRTMWNVARELFSQMMVPRYSPSVHAAMIDETVRHPARFAAILDEGELPIIALVTGLLEEGQRRGEIRTDVDAFEAAIVIGAGVMFSTTRVIGAVAEGQLPGSEIEAVAGRAFDLVWTGLGSEVPGKPGEP